MKNPTRREMLELAAAMALRVWQLQPRLRATAPEHGCRRTRCGSFPGFKSARVKTSGAEINLVHAGSGPPLLLMHGAPQTHVSMRLIAAGSGQGLHGDRARPARLRREQQAARRREPRELLEARDGARSGRGDEEFRLRQVRRRRATIAAGASAIAWRSITRTRSRGSCVLDIIPTYYLYTHVDIRLHPGLLSLVQQRARGAGARERSEEAIRSAEGARDERDSARVPAHVERSGEHPRDVRGLSRRRVDRSASTTRPTCRRRSRARC